ncbi:glycerol-3-phosphate 1-O-acyltransferase PlsY [Tenuibacillus multivorans]|uniref:Glycerol-3-phosphate acyltransferase n=1 Tax=Tenuibacillus multivorans TaxID=237069 RepID=A0A1H0CIY7_9BACI|nr:glycerol-3-phosphate 1-O-acyltransferase PlsY [Tenuibacillus multivorans]GEL76278.1 glycerol-3-phosphate acyltransferase [Tenuibacillus multivorans]SDN57813.1 glycerol-3-phosphate acyltransferase PlsY [Tenuibacillus multivorans]
MEYIIFAIIAYLLGSIPSALIIGKLFYRIDIREHGSGNLGGTNTFRVLGVKAGLMVTIMDILKGTAAIVIVRLLAPSLEPLIVGAFAVLGHTYPLFAKFRGGKAVATSGGVLLGVSPLLFAILILSFFGFLKLSKYVSLASMLTGIIAVIVSVIMQDLGLIIVTVLLASFVIYRHRTNIRRIKNKSEPKINWL